MGLRRDEFPNQRPVRSRISTKCNAGRHTLNRFLIIIRNIPLRMVSMLVISPVHHTIIPTVRSSFTDLCPVFSHVRVAFPIIDSFAQCRSAIMPVCARLRHVAGTRRNNTTYRDHVMHTIESCGFSPMDIQCAMTKLLEVYGVCGLDKAQQHFENSPY